MLTQSNLAAQARVEVSELLDLQLAPLGMRAIAELRPMPGHTVIDIGCGAGQSTLQLAQLVGTDGRVVGIDIDELILNLARHRADGLTQVSFLQADAQGIELADESADGIFSRFGVMAFSEPVAAFSNFRRILKPPGRLSFVCWRSLDENELDSLPLRAAGLEAMADPTPFSFADAGSLHTTLEAAGFKNVEIQAYDKQVSSGSLEVMAKVLARVGPLGRILRNNPDLNSGVVSRLRMALADRERLGTVALRAATWIVTAGPSSRRSA